MNPCAWAFLQAPNPQLGITKERWLFVGFLPPASQHMTACEAYGGAWHGLDFQECKDGEKRDAWGYRSQLGKVRWIMVDELRSKIPPSNPVADMEYKAGWVPIKFVSTGVIEKR